ncbi:geranylgeranyl transferase type-2 subunit alpha isoform X1 [Neodiprion lecontei]|uniref:Geranylgeranyl transferase type-2 subunit alpha n=1 Tax=Neodiprion lecontei TaxID=441921 RepID=A0A6J0BRC7_NEOLC|nr:geranylgeranyl transferase type-2 subunit alpha isoform X1 [Neodiprion lecontei]
MHGRVKVRTTAEQEELKKIERAKKVVQYRAGIDLIFKKRKEGIWDDEIFLMSEQMVLKNPDIYTLWNVRREAFGGIKWSQEDYVEQLKKELILTEHCLRANPKSYSVWHQRCWVNDHLPEPDWATELSLCAKCLNLDERNFHCWDYRQYVVKKAGIPEDEEFKFSTTKIETNFSNYSSWHYRSLILPKMFPDENGELPIREDKHIEELDLVMNATFTDPNDTSAWFYQRWLLNTRSTSNKTVWGIRMNEARIVIAFNKEVSLNKSNTQLKVDENLIDTEFRSCNAKNYTSVWIATFPENGVNLKRNSVVEVLHDGVDYQLNWSLDDQAWAYKSELPCNQEHNVKHLSTQLENYKQLAEIEPDNKWALLTGIILMKNIDAVKYHATILNDLDTLIRIDKKRSQYYKDLRSKYVIEFMIRHIFADKGIECEISQIVLPCMNLTTLWMERYMSFMEQINLAGNQLGDSLQKLCALQSCVKLSLSSNGIKSLQRFPTLESLRFLSLRDNKLSSLDEILDLVKRNNLTELDIRDNPVSNATDILTQLTMISPELKVFLTSQPGSNIDSSS